MHLVGKYAMRGHMILALNVEMNHLEGLGNSNREVREINILVLWCRELGLGTCRRRARSGEFVDL